MDATSRELYKKRNKKLASPICNSVILYHFCWFTSLYAGSGKGRRKGMKKGMNSLKQKVKGRKGDRKRKLKEAPKMVGGTGYAK